MNAFESKHGLILAGFYALLTSVVLYFAFQSSGISFWVGASFLLTLPWSLSAVFIGFLLIHMPHGVVLGAMLCTVLNTIILYFVGRSISDRYKQRNS
jgi:hypothetical protein